VSGSGTLLQALLDAGAEADYPVRVVAVGADRADIAGLSRAGAAGLPTFSVALRDHLDRDAWNDALIKSSPSTARSGGERRVHEGTVPAFLAGVSAPVLNTHPALLPAFPGVHAVRDALTHGVKITGCTLHLVDAGVDTGPVLAQRAVPVLRGQRRDPARADQDRGAAVAGRDGGRAGHHGATVTGREVSIP